MVKAGISHMVRMSIISVWDSDDDRIIELSSKRSLCLLSIGERFREYEDNTLDIACWRILSIRSNERRDVDVEDKEEGVNTMSTLLQDFCL